MPSSRTPGAGDSVILEAGAGPEATMSQRQRRALSRNYAIAAVASVVPLLVVVVVLAWFQFTAQRDQLLRELEDDAAEHNVMLSGLLKNVRDYASSLGTWSLHYMSEDAPGPLRLTGAAFAEAGGGLILREPRAAWARAGDIGTAYRLLQHMALAHDSMPYVRTSYLVATDGSFMSRYPVYDRPHLGPGQRSPAANELLGPMLTSEMMAGAQPVRNPDRHPFWTPAHLDPAGAGWVVTSAIPIDGPNGPRAVAGAAVLLDFLTGFLRAFDYACGRVWLVNDDNQVLAASDGPVSTGIRLQMLGDILPGDLVDLPRDDLLEPTGDLQAIGSSYVLTQAVGATPWKLLFIAHQAEVNAVLLPRFVPYGIILAGLILTLVLAHQLRERLIIRPALELVEYIRSESQERAPIRPQLPPVWRPSLDAVADAFAARRRSVEQIRDDAERLRALAGAHPVPLSIVPIDGSKIVYGNRAFARLFRLPPDQVVGTDVRQLYVDPRMRGVFLGRLRERGQISRFECEALTADGTRFPIALTSQLILFDGRESVVSAIIDLTEQKQAEAEIARSREALHQSEKLSALGSMLASVAHELNNPLSVVVGYATMMRDLAMDPKDKDRAVRIHAAAERCARIVRTFLAMARRKPESRDALRIEQVIDAALEIAGYGLRTTDVVVDIDLEPDLPELVGDADQLTLVVMNLIVNAQHALQATPPPRRLEIRVRTAGDEVRLEVEDNGPGIPDAMLGRIFEPFFTTKPQGVGTGIGLSVSRNIVLAHDGRIEFERPEGGGSRFVVVLPAQAAAPAVPAPGTTLPARTRGRILVVEDELEIADMLKEMLERDRHQVAICESGRDALAWLDQEPVDLIISDLHMPDVDGPELYQRLVAKRPELARRMVFMTGDVLAADVNGFLSRTGVPVIDKPIDPYDIRIKVRTCLEQQSEAPTTV